MTSSSDHPAWTPAPLSAGAAADLAPDFAGLPFEAAVAEGPAWLRPLRTSREEQLEIERARQRGADYRRGAEEALRKERVLDEERCRSALLAVKKVADHLEMIAAEFARDRERDLHGLAVAIARQVVQHELMMDPLRVGELVRRALELLPGDTTIEVRLNPEDLAMLGESVSSLLPAGRQVRMAWRPDPGLERGNFTAESPQRIVDGRTDVALKDLYERLEHD